MKTLQTFLKVAAGIGLGCISAGAGTFKADFNTDPTTILNFGGSLWDGSTITGTGSANWRNTDGAGPFGGTTNGPKAGVTNDGFLQLTFASSDCTAPNTSSLCGGVLFNDFDKGLTVGGFTFECDLRIGNGNPNPADGFSINYVRNSDPILIALNAGDTFPDMNGKISPHGGQFEDNGSASDLSLMEEGASTGLSIGFDMWDSGGYTMPPASPAIGTVAPGFVHDGISIDIRVDGELVAAVPMPNGTTQVTYSATNGTQVITATDTVGTNAANDPTSLETGPNDGTGCDTTLKWVHMKVDLSTNGVLNVYYKNTLIVSNLQTKYFASPGRLIMASRVGGNTANIEVDNVEITTIPASNALLAIGSATATLTGGSIVVYDSPPSNADTNTIALKLNGTAIVPNSVIKTNGQTTISFDTGKLFTSGETNTISLTIKDTQTPANTISADRQAVAPVYATITTNIALPIGSADTTKPGFLVHPYSTTAAQPNNAQWTEEQLAGLHGPNLADLTGADSNGYYTVADVINWDINTTAADGHFNDPDYTDTEQPGWPNINGATDNSSEEVITYLKFPAAGLYTMSVNSDDGFKVTAGLSPRDPFSAILLGQFDGGRGASDTIFNFLIPQAGVYPFRLIYENGGGGANCEWLTQTNGVFQLLNDTTNAVKAYRALTASSGIGVTVSGVFPPPNATGVPAGTNIVIQITDGTSKQLNPVSVQLWVNGATQQITTAKSGAVTTITGPSISPGMNNAKFVYGDNAAPGILTTGVWNFASVGLVASMAVTGIDTTKPGFWVHPYQTTNAQPNTIVWTEEQLLGLHGPNIANLSTADASGFIKYTGVINWDEVATNVNGDFNAPDFPDTVQPGWIVNSSGNADNATEEVYTYLYFPTVGTYTMGVNSDDGFKVTAGNPLKGTNALVLGQYIGGKGASDVLFSFPVTAPGYYPFRLLYENGGGGGNCEWFIQLADGTTDILINDTSNASAIKAYLGPEPSGAQVSGPEFKRPTFTNGVVSLSWTGSGTLQQSTNLTGQAGSWTDVSPQPTGTSYSVTPAGANSHVFYRIKQ